MIIGITGGVGAGKSTVMEYMQQKYDVYTILADDVAYQLQQPGQVVYEQMIALLGEEIVAADGQLDRSRIAAQVFQDEKLLKALNAIVHPAVKEEILHQIAEESKHHNHVAVEAALLIEEHYDEICDELWFVDAEDDVRIQRLVQTRGYSIEKAKEIMSRQLSREQFQKHCSRIIDNTGSYENLKNQLDKVLRKC